MSLLSKEKLFYSDVYQKGFNAVVINCDKSINGNFIVVLDKTAFYPEGGGQPSDIGKIDNARVLTVFEKDGIIFHETDIPLTIGDNVYGEIDFSHRMSNMQNHSGEHIVSGIIKSRLGYDNVGFHMGSEFITIDINGTLSDQDIDEIELLANEVVFKNLDIEILFPSESDYKKMTCRSKKELSGEIRVVQIKGVDTCACCGTHVARTGEIGIIKLISHQRYKGGTRISMLCGKRALFDYSNKNKNVYKISGLLSSKPNEIAINTENMLNENSLLKYKLVEHKLKLFKCMADSTPQCEKICVFEEDLNPTELKQLCQSLCEKAAFVLVLSESSESVYKYALGSLTSDISTLGKLLNEKFDGRGGGKGIMQGSFTGCREEIEEFFYAADQ
ncbi:MAG: alanyl-tRNA editing protein [Defluviitaleaceae bacterium]|nr:alanyl-tRNA editing protein [Defluviitaleaceae bacterium]